MNEGRGYGVLVNAVSGVEYEIHNISSNSAQVLPPSWRKVINSLSRHTDSQTAHS